MNWADPPPMSISCVKMVPAASGPGGESLLAVRIAGVQAAALA